MTFVLTPGLLASLRAAAQPSADPLEATRDVLWIALSVRKLSEAAEIGPALERRAWPARLHPRRPGSSVSPQDWGGAYEQEYSRQDWLSTLRLCGLLIHCYVIATTSGGVFFTSHVEKQEGLYFVEWAVLGQLVEAVCDESPRSGVIRAA